MKKLFFVLNIAGGVLIRAAILLASNGIMCMTNDRIHIRPFVNGFLRHLMLFPVCYFSSLLRNILTFILPWGFVSFYPVLHLIGKDAGTPVIFNYIALPVGIVSYLFAYLLWRIGLKVYRA